MISTGASLTVLFIILVNCSSSSIDNLSFDDELQLFTELQPVEGTENLIVNLKKGTDVNIDSWFVFEFRNIEDESVLSNGSKEGWCVEWNKPIRSDNTDHTDIKAFSTLNNEKWNGLNYFLNLKDELKAVDPELTFRDIQAVIWSLIGIPEFNLDQLADSDLPQRLLDENGLAAFNRIKVKEMVQLVNENSASFSTQPGDFFAILLETGEEKQNIMVPVILD